MSAPADPAQATGRRRRTGSAGRSTARNPKPLLALAMVLALPAVLPTASAAQAGHDGRAAGPSFDCARAGTAIERAICADPQLARADREVADLFARLRERSPEANRAALVGAQRAWLARRDRACARGSAVACLALAYAERAEELRALGAAPGTPAAAAVPETTAGPDLAREAQGRLAHEILSRGATSAALRRVMGARAFAAAKALGRDGRSFLASSENGYVVANICMPGVCTFMQTTFAFDRAGRAWASLTENGPTAYFGDPPADVRKLLTP